MLFFFLKLCEKRDFKTWKYSQALSSKTRFCCFFLCTEFQTTIEHLHLQWGVMIKLICDQITFFKIINIVFWGVKVKCFEFLSKPQWPKKKLKHPRLRGWGLFCSCRFFFSFSEFWKSREKQFCFYLKKLHEKTEVFWLKNFTK